MFKRLARGLRHTVTIIRALPTAPKRELLGRMIAFSRALPQQFNQPLPEMMAQLTPPDASANTLPGRVQPPFGTDQRMSESGRNFDFERQRTQEALGGLTADDIRQLADAVAAWHLRSSLGICLRRSLLRYYFLREAKVPAHVVFGARLKDRQEGGGLGGHAWLTLNDAPYYENPDDYTGFVVMYVYPQTVDGSR